MEEKEINLTQMQPTETQVPKIECASPKDFKLLRTLGGNLDGVRSVSWSPDGKYLASGSYDKAIATCDPSDRDFELNEDGDNAVSISIWDTNSGEEIKTLEEYSGIVFSVSWSPDGKYLASDSCYKNVIIWDINSEEKFKLLKGHSYQVNSVSWSPDGNYLASGSWDGTVKIWGVE